MIWRHFIIRVAWRLIVMFSLMFGLSYFIIQYRFIFSPIVLGALLAASVVELFIFITQSNRALGKFLFALKHRDFNVRFRQDLNSNGFKTLFDEFQSLTNLEKTKASDQHTPSIAVKLILSKIPSPALLIESGNIYVNASAMQAFDLQEIYEPARFFESHPAFKTLMGWNTSNQLIHFEHHELLFDVQRIDMAEHGVTTLLFNKAQTEHEHIEMDAWLKLIRILTHEIMNSVTSVLSLSATAKNIAQDTQSDTRVQEALSAINDRAELMMRFVDDYRKLTAVPAPRKKWLDVCSLVNAQLQGVFSADECNTNMQIAKDLKVLFDPDQLAQVLLNILLNSKAAMETGTAKLEIYTEKKDGMIDLSIKDNGVGISPSKLNDIFVPFYTTRSDGSGIGLSLSRQIMRNHGGKIVIHSEKGEGTTVILRIPN